MRPTERRCGAQLGPSLTLVRPLARGGMGVLWVAQHRTLGQEVVVKFLRDDREPDEHAAKRIAREAAAAASVRSSHVVQILDHGVHEGSPFIVMELLRGRDLGAFLEERGPLSLREMGAVLGQLAKALAKVHAAGLVHRDVKPSNLFLVEGEGELFIKLLDFGLARPATVDSDSTASAGIGAGTAPYMSPEQIAGRPLDSRSDVWSLGVVGFECLTGLRPFEGETVGATALAIHTSAPPRASELRPGLSVEIDAWFARACARDPQARFATAAAASEAFALAAGLEERLVEDAPRDEPRKDDGARTRGVLPEPSTHTTPWALSASAGRGRGRTRRWLVLPAAAVLGVGAWLSYARGSAAARFREGFPATAIVAEHAEGAAYFRTPNLSTLRLPRPEPPPSATAASRPLAPGGPRPPPRDAAPTRGRSEERPSSPVSVSGGFSLPEERR